MKNRRRDLIRTCVAAAALGWIIWQSAETVLPVDSFMANNTAGAFLAGFVSESDTKRGMVEELQENQGAAGRTSAVRTLDNPDIYPYDLTEEEMDVLYKVVSMECDTGYEGSLAVISCMMNRTRSDRYSDDLMEVVTEDSQFTAYYDKEKGTYPYVNREPSEECMAAVDDALYRGKRNIPSYILYFRSSEYESLNGYETYGQIGDNTYFYLNEDRYAR